MINELRDPQMQERWATLAESAWAGTQWAFEDFQKTAGGRRNVLNCAIPPAQAHKLTDFTFPPGWSLHNCLAAGIGFGAEIPDGLEEWAYIPKIHAVRQLPQLRELPAEHALLMRSPWFQSPSQALGLGINARHLRYHYQLWQELRPRTLRGVFTSLVYVTPQLSLSLAPHIDPRVLRPRDARWHRRLADAPPARPARSGARRFLAGRGRRRPDPLGGTQYASGSPAHHPGPGEAARHPWPGRLPIGLLRSEGFHASSNRRQTKFQRRILMIRIEHNPNLDLVRIVWKNIEQPRFRAKVRRLS